MGTNEAASSRVVSSGDSGELVTEENRNALRVRCVECGSLIISPGIGTYVPTKPFPLPLCRQKKDGIAVEKELIDSWWCVEKMLDFDNVGFTHACEGVKYLVCADCEMGPVGYLSLESQVHYIAVSRVTHEDCQSPCNVNVKAVDGELLQAQNIN